MLKDQRSCTVIETLKVQFSRHGIPTVLRTDNGPQYAAEEFRDFCESYGISHRTSSPHTPHSNGEAEKAVQTIKRLWHKASDQYLALLDYRTTPLESVGLSPAQLLMGRRPRNKLPSAQQLLMPRAYDPRKVKHQLDRCKASQKFYYDNSRASKHRLPLTPGEEVRMQPYPGNPNWSPEEAEVLHCGLWRKREMFPPTADNMMVPLLEKPPDSGQMLTYTTKSGRVVKPPQRLDL
uniref:Integrase catalytic domain-containing protein n=1 Tax=Labrus bergylta TaxID=56723 RepID=A0A3Q3E0D1_9LABR